jgi:imidazole glycerol-phosphate synthase subunit HisH
MVVIIDYGLGNLFSVAGALQHLGFDSIATSDRSQIIKASHLILPGVGAFPDGMQRLEKLDLVAILKEAVFTHQIPILGICLGFQLLCEIGEEFALTPGLGWIPARVQKLELNNPELRIPHMGWNEIKKTGSKSVLLQDIPDAALFYFVHSFHVCLTQSEGRVASSYHGLEFTSVFEKFPIFGVQFHPEKSQSQGLKLLKNFLEG